MTRMNELGQEPTSSTGHLKEKASELGANIRDIGSTVRDVAREKLEGAREQAQEYYEKGRRRAQQWEETVEHRIQEKPIQSLLLAAGAGLLLGILWRRR